MQCEHHEVGNKTVNFFVLKLIVVLSENLCEWLSTCLFTHKISNVHGAEKSKNFDVFALFS